VKIFKLHGDLFQRFMAWTIDEMDTYLAEVVPSLQPAIANRDVLVVGYSLRDAQVRKLVEGTGGSLWFTHPVQVPDHLAGNQTMRAVVSPDVVFENLFPALARELLLESSRAVAPRPERQVTAQAPMAPPAAVEGAQTMDDVLASVLAVAGPNGVLSATAFVLHDPRVIVADGYAISSLLAASHRPVLELIDHKGRRYFAVQLRKHTAHPFGPVLFQAPDDLRAPGLRMDSSPIQPGDVVHVAVAAGEKIGVSTGAATSGIDQTINIAPIGSVRALASLNAVVRAGSSGAPVVDRAMALRGFIVAGGSEANPVSFMYPTAHWMDFVLGRPEK